PAELPALDELERRGRANGLDGMRRLGPEQIRELEPHVAGIAGLHVPQTGIVDYPRVIAGLPGPVRSAGGGVLLAAPPPRRAPRRRRDHHRDAPRTGRVSRARQLRRPALRSRRGALRRPARTADRAVPRRVLRAAT